MPETFDTFDSTNIQAPFFGPGFPLYPDIDEMCRVSANRITGTNIYPAFVTQAVFTGALPALRDRIACYVWEPNGIVLQQGYYNCRLMGSYLGLPLYLTHCCPPGSSSSSSRSASSVGSAGASSAAPGCPTSTAAKGTVASATSPASITNITMATGDLLLVSVAYLSTTSPGATGSCKWNNIAMSQFDSVIGVGGSPFLNIEIYLLKVVAGATASATWTSGTGSLTEVVMTARSVSGLTTGAGDTTRDSTGTTSSSPATGSATTTANCELWWGNLAQFASGGPTVGTWGNSFTNGQTIVGATNLSLNEGYFLASTIGTIVASQTGTSQTLFIISGNSYK